MCIIKTGVMNMDYTLMLCGKDAFSYFFFVDLPPPAAQLGQMAKTCQKIRWGNSWNWLAILIPGTVWQIFNMKPWPETESESAENLFEKKPREITSSLQWTYFRRVFSQFEPLCTLPRPTPLPTAAASTPSPSQSVGAIFSMASMHS